MGASKVRFFKKRRPPAVDQDMLTAEIMYRMRGMFLDSQLQDAFALSVIADASYVSDEVAEREQQDSDKRFSKIEYLMPLIVAQCYQVAKATTELQRTKMGEEAHEAPEEYWDYYFSRSHQIAIASVTGAICQLVDIGLLSLGPIVPRSVQK
jgi:hypothetical protein